MTLNLPIINSGAMKKLVAHSSVISAGSYHPAYTQYNVLFIVRSRS